MERTSHLPTPEHVVWAICSKSLETKIFLKTWCTEVEPEPASHCWHYRHVECLHSQFQVQESQSDRMVWVGRCLKDLLVFKLLLRLRHLSPEQVAQTPSNLPLNISRDGTSTISRSNLLQCLTALKVKDFFLTSNLHLLSLKPLPLVLFLYALPFFLKSPLDTVRLLERSQEQIKLQDWLPFALALVILTKWGWKWLL